MSKKPPSEQSKVAKIIRAKLAEMSVTARVKSRSAAMVTAVDVYVMNLKPDRFEAVKQFCMKYEYEQGSARSDIPQVKYITVAPEYSTVLMQAAWEWCVGEYGEFEAFEPGTIPKDHSQIVLYPMHDLLTRALDEYDAPFWDVLKKAA